MLGCLGRDSRPVPRPHPVMSIRFLACLLLFQVLKVVEGVAINNGILGEPTISCGTDRISFWVKTQNPFEGKVYVKGEFGKGECVRTFGGTQTGGILQTTPITTIRPEETTCPPCPPCPLRQKRQLPSGMEDIEAMAHLTIAMGTCNVRRDRSLTPAGVTVTFTVVVSFHQHFITKVDKAYQIRCFYMEADKTVTSEIDVSMPQTTELTQQALMPRCEYTIRRQSPQGPIVRFARVGDQVFHRWECSSDTPEMFGMLVHDCYVDDGQGQRVQVINDKGCSNDPFALGDLTYMTNLLAYVEAHVFKFADRAALEFQCAISICVRVDGGCDGVSPPSCERTRRKRQLVIERVNRTLEDDGHPNQWRLHSQRLTVLDIDDKIDSGELAELERSMNRKSVSVEEDSGSQSYYKDLFENLTPRVCLSVVGFGVLVAVSTVVFTLASVALGTFYLMRRWKS